VHEVNGATHCSKAALSLKCSAAVGAQGKKGYWWQ